MTLFSGLKRKVINKKLNLDKDIHIELREIFPGEATFITLSWFCRIFAFLKQYFCCVKKLMEKSFNHIGKYENYLQKIINS